MGQKDEFRIGKYFLGKRDNSPVWCACWFDNASRQTKRTSLGERDVQKAKIALAAFVTREGEIGEHRPEDMTLATALERYWYRKAKDLPSADQAKIASRLILDHFQTATVAELTLPAQERFIEALRGRGYSGGYISRTLSVLRAALNHCHHHGELTSAPFVLDVQKGAPRERVLSVEELARLWDAIEDDHLRWFVLVALNTAARPDAILDLTRFQIDLDRGLIDLNPSGRTQTKKFRPTVPITSTLRRWLPLATGDHLVNYRGRPVKSIKTTWRRMRERAGFNDEVISYTLRHTVATELRARGVPEWECSGILGHRHGNSTTEIYAKYRPGYLGEAVRAIDKLMSEIDRCGEHRPISYPKPEELRARGVPALLRSGSETLENVVGAAGIEPATPTMST